MTVADTATVSATLFLLIVFLPFSLLYAADYLLAVRNGEEIVTLGEDLRRARHALREWWADDGTDDAPVWAEVLAMSVPFGLLFRTASHVFVARLHGLEGELADSDLSAGNAVASIRNGEETTADLNGRVVAFLVGVVLWWIYVPGQGPALSIDAGHALSGLVHAYVVLNIAVLFGDGVAFMGVLNRSQDTTSETTNGA